ncbi:MAG: endopeptidase IV [Campylobacteraceae bacterium 4484_4]|nr:MAG: endopeptidase IV [Campylobacteraceae bacterium 4484_4]
MDFFKKLFASLKGLLDFIQRYFKSLLFLLIVILIFMPASPEELAKPNLMRVKVEGPIIDAEGVLKEIKEAESQNIKGVLVIVNSPGGAVAPSVEIALALKRLKKLKPVVAYAAGTMASGSYYASIYADRIVANPGSTIGSIGVLFESMNIEALAKKIGIEEQSVQAGKYKQIGTPLRKWKPYEKEELKRLIDDTYEMFVTDVAKARGLDLNKSGEFADAHVFSAKRALQVGLIDEVGSIHAAEQELIRRSSVIKPKWKQKDRFETVMDRLFGETTSRLFTYLEGLKAY